jgi:hypothetical protein
MAPITTAAAVAVAFAAWAEVTPTTLTVTVPEFSWVGPMGAVQPPHWRTARPVQTGCPEYDDAGKVIGYSLTCKDARP